MKLVEYVKQNKSHLCIGLGFAFYVGAMLELCSATVKATRKIDKMKEEEAEQAIVPIDPEDVAIPATTIIKETYKYYIYGGIMTCASIGLIGSGIYGIDKENLGWVSSYLLSKAASENYQEATKEIVGETKEKKIKELATEKEMNNTPVNPECTGDGNTLYYIPYFHIYFRSSPEAVNHGILEFLKRLNRINEAQSFGDFLNELNVYPDRYAANDVTNKLGWKPEDNLDVSIKWKESSTEPCGLVIFSADPHEDFDRLH